MIHATKISVFFHNTLLFSRLSYSEKVLLRSTTIGSRPQFTVENHVDDFNHINDIDIPIPIDIGIEHAEYA